MTEPQIYYQNGTKTVYQAGIPVVQPNWVTTPFSLYDPVRFGALDNAVCWWPGHTGDNRFTPFPLHMWYGMDISAWVETYEKNTDRTAISYSIWTDAYFWDNYTFPTDKGPFFDRFPFGAPTLEYRNWPAADKKIFFQWYSAIPYSFAKYDATIRDTVNLSGDDTVKVRNALAELFTHTEGWGGGAPEHTDNLFMLHYDRWDTVIMPLLRKYYPWYDFYITNFQEKIIVPYWDARTAAETEQRTKTIQAVALTVAAGVLTLVTLGVSAATVGAAAAPIVTAATGVDISSGAITSAIDAVGGVSTSGVNLNPSEILTTISRGVDTAITQIQNTQITIPDIPQDLASNVISGINQTAAALTSTTVNTQTSSPISSTPTSTTTTTSETNNNWWLILVPLLFIFI